MVSVIVWQCAAGYRSGDGQVRVGGGGWSEAPGWVWTQLTKNVSILRPLEVAVECLLVHVGWDSSGAGGIESEEDCAQ